LSVNCPHQTDPRALSQQRFRNSSEIDCFCKTETHSLHHKLKFVQHGILFTKILF
jgi:hypothetical protein